MPNQTWVRCFIALTIAAAALPATVVETSGGGSRERRQSGASTSGAAETTHATYVRLPLRFEPAPGQGGSDAFVARGSGYAAVVSASGASLLLKQLSKEAPKRLIMSFVGGDRQAQAHMRRPMPGVSNYVFGNDPKRWVTGVRGYGAIEYHGLYPGIDVAFYGNQQQLEFDFVVAPGATPEAIALAFDGATGVNVDREGDLEIATEGGRLVQHRPVIYQDDHGTRRPVRGGYVIRRGGTIGFRIGKYDRRLPLVIDPTLSYATYLGGVKQERANSVAVDAAGNAIVAGVTYSPDFPALNGIQPQKKGFGDVFVTKLTAAGDAVVYSTFFGGSQDDAASGVAVDADGSAYVAGNTESWDFPASSSIGSIGNRRGPFVLKLDAAGSLVYAARVGGAGSDSVNGIAVDRDGRATIVGMTSSADFPMVTPWQGTPTGHPLLRTNDSGGTWSRVTAGLQVSGLTAFAFDHSQSGTLYAGSVREGVFRTVEDGATWTRTGLTPQTITAMTVQESTLFAAGEGGLYRSRDRGDTWTAVLPFAFVSAMTVTQESPSVVYAGMGWSANVLKTLDGGDTWVDTGLAGPVQSLASSGSTVYAVTTSGVFRSTAGGQWQAANGSSRDILYGTVAALAVDPVDPQIAYAGTTQGLFKTTSGGGLWSPVAPFSSYVGFIAIAPSDPSTIFVATSAGTAISHDGGNTWSPSGLGNDPLLAVFAFDPADGARMYAGCTVALDAFVATLSADGSRLEYSTFIGGTSNEAATSVAVDANGNRYITGDTFSSDFPTVHPLQGTFGGTWDSFVVKISPAGVPVYSTYLGGSMTDYNARIAADAAGRAYVTGLTLSTDFPVVNAWQPVHGGGFSDVFVTALNEDGSRFVYSTFLGGSAMENDWSQSLGPAIAATPSGEVFVTGSTQSTNFPVTPDAWHRTHAGGGTDVFVSHFDGVGALRYSTLLGGQGADYARGIALDSTEAMIITGHTDSTDWATTTAPQPLYAGSEDGFVVRMSPETAPPDTIAPTTTIAVSGTPGIPGWYKSPVTVSLSALDNDRGRGIASIEYSMTGGVFQRYTGPFTVKASGITRITARATDWAGNIESPAASTTVAIDTSAPVVSFGVSGTFGSAGWFKSSVTVSVFAVETSQGSGVVSTEYRLGDGAFQSYTAPFKVAAEGVTQITARAMDANGNVATSTRTIMIDTSAPRTNIAVSGTAGLGGWYTSAITVSLSAADNGSGSGVGAIEYCVNDGPFQRYGAPFTLTTQGATRITARATDRAGNVESTPSPTTLMIDSSTPAVAVASPEAREYQHADSVGVSFLATDGVSGVQAVSAALDGVPVQNGQSIALLALGLGAHTLDVSASDAAGNQARQSVSFRIVATIDSLIASVNVYAGEGKIDASARKSLLAKLNDAKAALDRGNRSAATGNLRDFMDQCAAQSGKGVSPDVAAALTGDTAYVLTTI